MAITKEEVLKIANLARINLTDEEVERYQPQLSAILGYIEQLQEVDTKGVELTAQVTNLKNIYHEDKAKPWPEDEREAALAQAPELVENLIKVDPVF